MGIGYRIKEARERMGLTQTELGNLVGVTGSAITNYEKETSHPKEQIIYKLIDTLNVDANYLFQDAVKTKLFDDEISFDEKEFLEKYRQLTFDERDIINSTVDKMLRMNKSRIYASGQLSLFDLCEDNCSDASTTQLKAAHNDHENEPGELEKMQRDIANLKKPE